LLSVDQSVNNIASTDQCVKWGITPSYV